MLSRETVIGQFRRPHGALGLLAGAIMALRPSNRQRNLWTLQLLGLQAEDHLLEIGCGPGVALRKAAAAVPRGSVTATDHSPLMARMARLRVAGLGNVSVETGGLSALAAAEGSLNAIYSANVIQFLPDPAEFFTLARKALAARGKIATTYQPRGGKVSADDALRLARRTEDAMREAGFEGIRSETLALEPVPAVCVLGHVP